MQQSSPSSAEQRRSWQTSRRRWIKREEVRQRLRASGQAEVSIVHSVSLSLHCCGSVSLLSADNMPSHSGAGTYGLLCAPKNFCDDRAVAWHAGEHGDVTLGRPANAWCSVVVPTMLGCARHTLLHEQRIAECASLSLVHN